MTVFTDYARYYDLLNRDKDYRREADFVHSLLRKFAPEAVSLLDLGCGTGRHDRILTEMGYQVTGIDLAEEMLEIARASREGLPENSLRFVRGDVRTVRVDALFDAVISLFHVMSYQTSNDDLRNTFATASRHLKGGGIFLFDFWYGPAVLTERPSVRVKNFSGEGMEVVRIAQPDMHLDSNTVDVNYRILVNDNAGKEFREINETHRMRYLFFPEIELFAAEAGFQTVSRAEWLTGAEPGADTWGIYCVLRKM
jgi:SAM-dependent methyltransferase